MTLTSSDIIIIKSLLQSEYVDIYDLHVQYLLSPAQLQLSISKFLAERIIEVDGVKIRLIKNGFDWICNNRQSIFLDPKRRFWKDRPQDTQNASAALNAADYIIAINDIIEESEEGN